MFSPWDSWATPICRERKRDLAPMRAARIWSACLVGWWTFTLARSVLLEGIPVRYAVLYGRDFLYFAILLPLALRARIPPRSLRIGVAILFGGAVVYAVGQTIAGLTGHTLSWLVHPANVANDAAEDARDVGILLSMALRAGVPEGQLTVRECAESYHVATLDNDAEAIFEGSVTFIQAVTAGNITLT